MYSRAAAVARESPARIVEHERRKRGRPRNEDRPQRVDAPTAKKGAFIWRGVVRNANAVGRLAPALAAAKRQASSVSTAVGRRFGSLLAVRAAIAPGNVLTRCDCGTERTFSASKLITGAVRECGSKFHTAQDEQSRLNALVGQKFGAITVVALGPSATRKGRGQEVLTECECGERRLVQAAGLEFQKNCGGPAHEVADWRDSLRKEYKTYAIEAVGVAMMKVGRSQFFERRLRALQTASPVRLRVFAWCEEDIESSIHDELERFHSHGEWFVLNEESRAIVMGRMREYSPEDEIDER